LTNIYLQPITNFANIYRQIARELFECLAPKKTRFAFRQQGESIKLMALILPEESTADLYNNIYWTLHFNKALPIQHKNIH